MLDKLKQHWKVNALNMVLIICTFALGGTLCASAGKKLLDLLHLSKGNFSWIAAYIVIITILWPFSVLLISIPLGQYPFFKAYLVKVWHRINGTAGNISVAVFASGAGSNAQKIIERFNAATPNRNQPNHPGKKIRVSLVVCNKPAAGVIQIAEKAGIKTLIIEKERFFSGDHYLPELKKKSVNFIVLAGFLWKIPSAIIKAYPGRIVNIHPALLPKHGGKGMYGDKVHEAVIAAGEKESGISIHYVDELYDHGNIIFQATCSVDEKDTPTLLAAKIHLLEHQHYPAIIEQTINKLV